MRKGYYQQIAIFAMIVLFSYMLVQNPFSELYVEKLKHDSLTVSSSTHPLYKEIMEKAKNYEKPASDAKIDRVWKKMPGYNGLKVDIEASFEKMKPHGKFLEEKLVYKQTSPRVHLHQLPPSPIYRGHPEKPMVTFLINVAWGNEYLSSILQDLKKHHVYATFFLEGRWAKQHPELVKMIDKGGHEIGNHSYSHPDMKKISRERIVEELQKTNEIIQATTGKTPIWFAPPSGSFRNEVVEIAANMKMETIMWTVDTIDWQKPSPSVIINRVLKQVHNGAIILMHPTESTAKALDTLINNLKKKGYKIGSLSELLDEKRIVTTDTTQ